MAPPVRTHFEAVFALSMLLIIPVAANADALPTALKASGSMSVLANKAKKEGSLLVYGAPGQDKMEKWFKGFQLKYGIPVQYYRAPTNPLYQRFSQEQEVGKVQADVLLISEPNLLAAAAKRNWIAKYTPQAATQFPRSSTIPGRAYPLFLSISGTGWNTRVTPPDLQQKLLAHPLRGLLDPRLKGKIALVTILAGGPQIAGYANLVIHQPDKYGWGFLKKLAKQRPVVLASTPNLLDAVIAGDYWATPDANPSVFAPKAVEGAPIKFKSPTISAAAPFYVSVVAHSPQPYAARLFEEWATSLKGQDLLANVTQSQVTINGWKDVRAIRKLKWYAPPKQLWFGWATSPDLEGSKLKAFYAHWQRIFGRAGQSSAR